LRTYNILFTVQYTILYITVDTKRQNVSWRHMYIDCLELNGSLKCTRSQSNTFECIGTAVLLILWMTLVPGRTIRYYRIRRDTATPDSAELFLKYITSSYWFCFGHHDTFSTVPAGLYAFGAPNLQV